MLNQHPRRWEISAILVAGPTALEGQPSYLQINGFWLDCQPDTFCKVMFTGGLFATRIMLFRFRKQQSMKMLPGLG